MLFFEQDKASRLVVRLSVVLPSVLLGVVSL